MAPKGFNKFFNFQSVELETRSVGLVGGELFGGEPWLGAIAASVVPLGVGSDGGDSSSVPFSMDASVLPDGGIGISSTSASFSTANRLG